MVGPWPRGHEERRRMIIAPRRYRARVILCHCGFIGPAPPRGLRTLPEFPPRDPSASGPCFSDPLRAFVRPTRRGAREPPRREHLNNTFCFNLRTTRISPTPTLDGTGVNANRRNDILSKGTRKDPTEGFTRRKGCRRRSR